MRTSISHPSKRSQKAQRFQPVQPAQTVGTSARRVVCTTHHHVEVLASPGSGKTHTLIARLSHLLTSGVPAAQILVLSFSNEAVRELRRRMDLACTADDVARCTSDKAGGEQRVTSVTGMTGIRVSTAHAFARSLLRKPPAIITDKAQRKLLARSIKMVRKSMRHREIWADISTAQRQRRRDQLQTLSEPSGIRRLLALFDYHRAAGVTIRQALNVSAFSPLGKPAAIEAIWRQYQEVKRDNHSQDFADILETAARRIQRGRLRLKFRYVLIDEFQDCSTAQTRLLALLAQHSGASIMAFGDPAQSLYGFSGTHYAPLADFLPDVQRHHLPLSHRLTHETAALANQIAQLDGRSAIRARQRGQRPALVLSSNETQQTRRVVADIQRLLADGVAPSDIAVLARTKSMLHTVEAALLTKSIDCNRLGGNRSQSHVENVLRLVRWTQRWHQRSQPVEPRQLEGLRTENIKIDCAVADKQARALMRTKWPLSLEGQYQLCAHTYLRLLGGMRTHPEIAAQVNRWEPMCRQHTNPKAMRAALHQSAWQGIVTGTIHSAKGREWRHVLVVGATEGILPIYHARNTDALAQERNLLYVAITRAKDQVRLYHAPIAHARTRHRFDRLNPLLDVAAAHKLMTITRAKTANAMNANAVTAD